MRLRVARCMPGPYLGLVALKFLPWIFSQISSSRQPSIDSQIAPEGSAEYWLQHTGPMLLCTSCGRRGRRRRGRPRRIRRPGKTARPDPIHPAGRKRLSFPTEAQRPAAAVAVAHTKKGEAPVPLGYGRPSPPAGGWGWHERRGGSRGRTFQRRSRS